MVKFAIGAILLDWGGCTDGPRQVGRPSEIAPYLDYLRERVSAFSDLTAARLTPGIRDMGDVGAYTTVKQYLAAIWPENGPKPLEVRFEIPPTLEGRSGFDSRSTAQRLADDPPHVMFAQNGEPHWPATEMTFRIITHAEL